MRTEIVGGAARQVQKMVGNHAVQYLEPYTMCMYGSQLYSSDMHSAISPVAFARQDVGDFALTGGDSHTAAQVHRSAGRPLGLEPLPRWGVTWECISQYDTVHQSSSALRCICGGFQTVGLVSEFVSTQGSVKLDKQKARKAILTSVHIAGPTSSIKRVLQYI
jgi:hypothetical protein